MKQVDAIRILGMFGDRLIKEPSARRDVTAMCVVIADLADWDVAADFAGALGLEGDQCEAIHQSWTKGRTP